MALLGGCASDPDIRSRRVADDVYLVSSDRCAVIGRAELLHDIELHGRSLCKGTAVQLEQVRSMPSRQGSLLGECLHAGALQAQVRCGPAETRQ